MWQSLADSSLPARFVIKTLLFVVVLGAVLFPNPVLLVRQIGHFRNHDALIEPNMAAMKDINAEIDKLMPTNAVPKDEFKVVERYIYRTIKYQYDWYNWLNADYWPTATEVWQRKREDCDGRAVLAASILRARGYTNAMLVANVNHVWVDVDGVELMGPHAEKNLRREGNKVILSLPGFKTLRDMVAQLSAFPALRSITIILIVALLLFHPCRHKGAFCLVAALALGGYVLLFEWSMLAMKGDFPGFPFNFIVGALLEFAAAGAALFAARFFNNRRGSPRPAPVEDARPREIVVKLTQS
jgi:hypothetical protein